MKVTWLTRWEEIQDNSFIHQWDEMLDAWQPPHVFFTQPLCNAWLATYRPIRYLSPRYLLLEDGNDKLLWPLVLWKQNWRNAFRRMLIAVGHSDFDYAEPIFIGNRSKLLAKALEAIHERQREWDVVTISGLTQQSTESKPETDFCPFCKLEGYENGESFLKKSKKSLREDIRRQHNRISTLGTISFASASVSEALHELPTFLEEHRAHWPKAYKAPGFHENLVKFGQASGLVSFDMLRVKDTTIAWHLGFHYKGRFYYYMPAANREWLQYSPNKLLLFELVNRAIVEKDMIFDHLRGAENYKFGWASECQSLWQINVKSHNDIGSFLRNGLYACRTKWRGR